MSDKLIKRKIPENITPRKFVYEEREYFGNWFLVELTEYGLEMQETTPCIPFLQQSDVVKSVSNSDWCKFIAEVEKLSLKPIEKDDDDMICDGHRVECHITFYRTLVKFDIINPQFKNFKKLRELINDLTICEQYPKGLFYFNDY